LSGNLTQSEIAVGRRVVSALARVGAVWNSVDGEEGVILWLRSIQLQTDKITLDDYYI